LSNLNKQAVYDLFFRIGKIAAVTKIAAPPPQHKSRIKKGLPTKQELELLQKFRDEGNAFEANNLETTLRSIYPEYNKANPEISTSKKRKFDDAAIRRAEIQKMNTGKAKHLANLLTKRRDNFSDPSQGTSYVKNYQGNIGPEVITQLARLENTAYGSETEKNRQKYVEDQDLTKRKLDEVLDNAMKYKGIPEIVNSNMADDDKEIEIAKILRGYYGDDGKLQPPQQVQTSPTVAPAPAVESNQIIDDEGIANAVDNLVTGFNKNREANNNPAPTQKQEITQDTSPTKAPVAQPSTPATPQTPKLTGNALQRRLADLEAETQREAAQQADAKINRELAKLNGKPQVDTFDRTKALNNLKGGLGERSPSYVNTSKIEPDPIPADRTYSSYLPAIDPSAKLNFGMGETPPDLVFTEEDLATLNSQYPEASPIDTPPVVPQTPRANNNAPVAAKPSTQANDLSFNEPKETPRSKQDLVQEYYGMSSTTNPNAKPQQFYTIKNAPSQGYAPIQGITSRISTGNFGPAPTRQAPAPVAPTRPVNRVTRKPAVSRPAAAAPKPTFNRQGFNSMMSDFGYSNPASPKPIPSNITKLLPQSNKPISQVVGPAKPLNEILQNTAPKQ